MQRSAPFAVFAIAITVGWIAAQQPPAPRLTSGVVRDLQLRNITGTFSSGRIADVAVDPRNRSVWYVATASGGLWKTTNRGLTFQPIFDQGGSYSLGCVTLDPKNPDVVWLGTGENQAQRTIGYGNGVHKSTDGGKTWHNRFARSMRYRGQACTARLGICANRLPQRQPAGEGERDAGEPTTVRAVADAAAVAVRRSNPGCTP